MANPGRGLLWQALGEQRGEKEETGDQSFYASVLLDIVNSLNAHIFICFPKLVRSTLHHSLGFSFPHPGKMFHDSFNKFFFDFHVPP